MLFDNVPSALRPTIYAASDAFVSPADNLQESFGLALLEASAAGLPVICSDWSGYREVVKDGVDGFLIPTRILEGAFNGSEFLAALLGGFGAEASVASQTIVDPQCLSSAMLKVAKDEELRAEMGKRGREKVTNGYLWADVIRSFSKLWHEQLETHDPRDTKAPTLNLQKAFQHYATTILDPALAFVTEQASAGGSQPLHSLQQWAHRHRCAQSDIAALLRNGKLKLVQYTSNALC